MTPELTELGFNGHFVAQLAADDYEKFRPVRVIEVQRSGITVSDGNVETFLEPGAGWLKRPAEDRPTVGDWLLVDADVTRIERVLDRKTLFKRGAAGERSDLQLIAANVDTLFIVSSCNDEFNESRLERYLALAIDAGAYPVVVLTKADLADDPASYRARAESLRRDLAVEVVNALDADSLFGATAWVSTGSTVALVGSSGVGKSTIVNTLAGRSVTPTAGIREKDARGRHTTTSRNLHRLEGGGLLLDVPGMRELKVAEAAEALDELFDDIAALAAECRFGDCGHAGEPGCAVAAALEAGRLSERRLENYRKLKREEAHFSKAVHERRAGERAFGRVVKDAISMKRGQRSDRGDN